MELSPLLTNLPPELVLPVIIAIIGLQLLRLLLPLVRRNTGTGGDADSLG